MKERCKKYLDEVRHHLTKELIPFWMTHGEDKEYGGFLTYLDTNGNPTGESVKTLICQTRMIYTAASAHRAGLGDGYFLRSAQQGAEFLVNHFWDKDKLGFFWTTERDGTPINRSKLTYGQSFAIYALSELGMASGEPFGTEWALKTYETIQTQDGFGFCGYLGRKYYVSNADPR